MAFSKIKFTEFQCIICGARLCNVYQSDAELAPNPAFVIEPTPSWLCDYRLVYPSRCRPSRANISRSTEPYSCSRGRIARTRETGLPIPYAEVWDDDPTIPERLSARVLKWRGYYHRPRVELESCLSLPSCFPVHQACWDIFQAILKKLHIKDDGKILATLYQAANLAPSTPGAILWPHGYGEERMNAYWASRGSCAPEPVSPIEDSQYRFSYIEASPTNQPLHAYASCLTQGSMCDPFTILGTRNGEMPSFLPFSQELIDEILSYLSMSDLISLQQVTSSQKVEISQYVWKALFHPRAEFGFLEAAKDEPDTWHQHAISSVRLVEADWSTVQNRRRIWQLCLSIVDFIHDTNPLLQSIDLAGFPVPMTPDEIFHPHGLVLRALSPESHDSFDDNNTGSQTLSCDRLGNFKASHVSVSYVGSGEMRFMSGLKFFPGGQSVGRFNPHDQKLSTFNSGSGATNFVLWAASSEFGLLDLAITEGLNSTPVWKIGGRCNKAAITRRYLTIKDGMLEVQSLYIGLEISRITELGIWSNDITSIVALDRRESFIQRNIWASGIVAPFFNAFDTDIAPFYGFREMEVEEDDSSDSSSSMRMRSRPWGRYGYRAKYIPRRKKTEFHPMKVIFFRDEIVVRFTCWTKISRDISGIEVLTKDGPNSSYVHVLGRRDLDDMASIDIILEWEKGEVISGINIVTLESHGKVLSLDSMNTLEAENEIARLSDNGPIVGIEVCTSFGRKFHFNNWPDSPDSKYPTSVRKLNLDEGRRIVGFYGRSTSNWEWGSLESIGIISDASPSPTISRAPDIDSPPVNAQLVPGYRGAWIQRGCVRHIDDGHFQSFISLSKATSITPYYRLDDAYYTRKPEPYIVGFVFTYEVDDTALSSSRSIWGQVAGACAGTTVFTNFEGDEVVTNVSLRKPRPGKGYLLAGLELWTSRGRQIYCGDIDCDEGQGLGSLDIGEKDLLLWEYKIHNQYFFVQRESGEKVQIKVEVRYYRHQMLASGSQVHPVGGGSWSRKPASGS
ncbi:hypothetical protein TWF281_009094 [Arthrobotrys megalospora]